MAEKKNNFGAGILLGAAIGAVAALFLTPKSGKENRKLAQQKLNELREFIESKEAEKRAREIFGNVSEQSKKMYEQMKVEMNSRMDQMKSAIDTFDTGKYQKVVDEILVNVRKQVEMSSEQVEKAKTYLLNFIEENQKKANTAAEKAEKKVAKQTEKTEKKPN